MQSPMPVLPVPTCYLRIIEKIGMIKPVSKNERLFRSVMDGRSDANVHFPDLCRLLKMLGFEERIRGDHHIFTRTGMLEIINIQPKQTKAKPYQVKQVRGLILKYRLHLKEEGL